MRPWAAHDLKPRVVGWARVITSAPILRETNRVEGQSTPSRLL